MAFNNTIPLWIVHGFLGSGKTRLLNSLSYIFSENLDSKNEIEEQEISSSSEGGSLSFPLAYIKCEDFHPCHLEETAEIFYEVRTEQELATVLDRLVEEWSQALKEGKKLEGCFLEYNGTWQLTDLWNLLSERPEFSIVQVLMMLDARTFMDNFTELKDYLWSSLLQADYVCYFKQANISPSFLPFLKSLPLGGKILDLDFSFRMPKEDEKRLLSHLVSTNLPTTDEVGLSDESVSKDELFDIWQKRWYSLWKLQKYPLWFKVGLAFASVWALLLAHHFLHLPEQAGFLQTFKQYVLSSNSLLLQIFPFLLISAAVSSFLQLFVKDAFLKQVFGGRWYFSLPLLLVSSLFLPICDCGLLPITTRLAKKTLRIARSLFFFMIATVMNPLVIASTYYAFVGQEYMVTYRLVLGSAISLLAYYFFATFVFRSFSFFGSSNAITNLYCQASYGVEEMVARPLSFAEQTSFGRYAFELGRRFFSHTTQEFFLLFKNICVGVFLSQALHVLVPLSFWQHYLGYDFAQILFLIFAVVFLSVCANANAFMAKSFAFFLNPPLLLIYMVFAPLFDFKNLLLLYQGFGKQILKRYLFVVFFIFLFCLLVSRFLPANIFNTLPTFSAFN